ncbi:TM2 domain-containing protein [Tenacibaculum maritimum]|uniref:TM2 domain-containing protein n=1 Tax=Tenacibaculum maritimum TaxID=107401 RepID=UPI003875B60C
MKSNGTAYVLWFFLGIFSAHRFYLGKTGSALIYLFTGQLFGIGWIIDAFILGGMVDKYNLIYGAKSKCCSKRNGPISSSSARKSKLINQQYMLH